MSILNELKKRVLICDGGMGSLLQSAGLAAGELPETWNIARPEIVKGIHRSYLEAGADIVTINTFGANAVKYGGDGNFALKDVVRAGCRNAREAIAEAGHGYAALDLGPTGKLLEPMGDLPFEKCVRAYEETIREGVEGGTDLIIIETMSDLKELKAAVLAAKEYSSLPVFATVTFDQSGKLLTGGTPEAAVALLEGLRVDALGVNCGLGPLQLKSIVERMLRVSSTPVIVNPNAGLPRVEGGKTVYDITPEEFAEAMKEILEMGASVIGGCCGTTPEHIALLKKMAGERKAPVITEKTDTVISSYSSVRIIGEDPTVIGECINPTGKQGLKKALREGDSEYVMQMAVQQERAGAHALDVNAGLPGIDEAAVLEDLVIKIQSVTDLPLQIDTADPAAMKRALRVYSGKALINSVNGKQEVMDAVFPLAAKYGGVLVALLLDESGIPESAEGRLAIARRIVSEAEKYGISKKDLLFDCVCMTVSSGQQSGETALETIRKIRGELGCRTVLGVSNISFGLPLREIITSAFLAEALRAGLSAAIINPNSELVMGAYRAHRVLAGYDVNCAEYVELYSVARIAAPMTPALPGTPASPDASPAAASSSASPSGEAGESKKEELIRAVQKGMKELSSKLAEELLHTMEGTEVVNECMIPALNLVGRSFEDGTIFLPQLLMSAEAAKSAFKVISDAMEAGGKKTEKKGTVLLATVAGDIHDIGKNIVKVLLENYSFEVMDLGKDVPPGRIVEETCSRGIRLVGLSALMTTTVGSMEETIRRLRAAAPDTKIAVGGAVLTEEYARAIGADAYCSDAMATVRYAESVF